MKIEWQEDGDLLIKFGGCYDCTGESVYITPKEFDALLKQRPKIEPACSGLSKIEPLGRYYSHDDIINKLNEVIEKVNLMMEVMNQKASK